MTEGNYKAARLGYEYWAVCTPSGFAEEILAGSDAEKRVRALVDERNAELDEIRAEIAEED